MEPTTLPMRILLADGDPAFAEKAFERLRSVGEPAVHLELVGKGPLFLDTVFSHPYDLILLDAALPGASSLDLLGRLLQTSLPLPVVMLTAKDDARLAVEAMKRGVLDFLLKDDFLSLDMAAFLRRMGEASRQRRENAELQQVAQMKNDFLATISHELRTPLTSILGLSEVLVSGRLGAMEKKQGESLNKILEQSHNLVRLINQLLDVRSFSQNEKRPEAEVVSISALARERTEAARPLFERKGVHFEATIPASPLEVHGRREDLSKVFEHLISNALKFTQKGGQVVVEVMEDGRQAQVRVSDNGQGIPTESMRFMFQKFYHVDQTLTRSYGGMGLGLAFCKEAVESMGGRIWVESKGAGHGASVAFSLPRIAVPAPASRGSRQILWVDDNPSMLDLVEVGFSSVSRAVTLKTARGGVPALELLKTFTPDLVVLDIMMADMDGLEVLKRIREDARTAAIPVLVVSGYKEAAKAAVQRGANDFCLKPFRVADVVKKIESLLFQDQ
jgi:signal transduction histidine kinase